MDIIFSVGFLLNMNFSIGSFGATPLFSIEARNNYYLISKIKAQEEPSLFLEIDRLNLVKAYHLLGGTGHFLNNVDEKVQFFYKFDSFWNLDNTSLLKVNFSILPKFELNSSIDKKLSFAERIIEIYKNNNKIDMFWCFAHLYQEEDWIKISNSDSKIKIENYTQMVIMPFRKEQAKLLFFNGKERRIRIWELNGYYEPKNKNNFNLGLSDISTRGFWQTKLSKDHEDLEVVFSEKFYVFAFSNFQEFEKYCFLTHKGLLFSAEKNKFGWLVRPMYENKEKPIVAVVERHDHPKGIMFFARDLDHTRKDDTFFEMENLDHKIPYDRNQIPFRFFWEPRIQVIREYAKISETYRPKKEK